MIMLSDKVLHGRQFVEYATGDYYLKCDTLREVSQCFWSGYGKPISKYWRLTDIHKVPDNAYVIIVQVSRETDYSEYDYYIMRVYKPLVKKFLERMNEDN